MIPATTKRVKISTSQKINQRIKTKTIQNIKKYTHATQGELTKRIHQLNHEWDTERVLETNAALVTLFSVILGLTNERWFMLVFIVSFFF